MKKIIILFLLSIFLVSCFQEKAEKIEKKQEFILETKNFWDFEKKYFLEKTSKIEPSSEVILFTKISWKVEKINVKEWEKIKKWQNLVSFSDDTLFLWTNHKQSLLALEQAKINYENQKINLEKNINDIILNIEKQKNNLENAKKTLDQDLIQAQNNFQNSNLNLENSKSSLDVEKIENAIEKQKFDLETLKKTDSEKIDSFILNLKNQKDNLNNLYISSVEFWDNLFNVKNPLYQSQKDVYIWPSDTQKKQEAKDFLKKMIDFQENDLSNLNIENKEEIQKYMEKIDFWHKLLNDFLNSTLETLNNSLTWVTWFTELEKNNFLTKLNSLSSTNFSLQNAFISLKNQINSFLKTYKDNEKSILKQIELAKKDKEIAIKNINNWKIISKSNLEKVVIWKDDKIMSLELQLKTLENNLNDAKKIKDITLKNLENNIKMASLNVEKSQNELSKLTLFSPISWQIKSVNLEVWQTYSPWKEAIKIISESKREVDVFVSASDFQKIKIWDKVKIEYSWQEFEAEVFSKSNIANETLNYKINISLNKDINLVWWVAKIIFELKSDFPLLPINSVKIDGENTWYLNILKDWKIENLEVNFWENYLDFIEIKTKIPENTKIILNDVSNYDQKKFILKTK